MTPNSARILFAQARFAGRKIRHTVGHWPDVKVGVGRELATTALADIKARRTTEVRAQVPDSVRSRQVALRWPIPETWLREHVRGRVRRAPPADYESRLRLHILPRLGHLPVAGLSWEDANKLHVAMATTPRTANYAIDILRTCSAMPSRPSLSSDNPVDGNRRNTERSSRTVPEWGGVRPAQSRPSIRPSVKVLSRCTWLRDQASRLTGARRSEIANAR